MHEHWVEFGKVALAHLLAVASPGPDFAIVLRQSLRHGRTAGVWTSAGVATAILLHVSYSLLGIGLLIRNSELWFSVFKYAGAAYIAWLGLRSLAARPPSAKVADRPVRETDEAPTPRRAFATGFLTNALNPKVSLFFLALFAMVISAHTPKLIQAGYGVWTSAATFGWFSLVSMVFTREPVTRAFLAHGHWIDRLLGVVFIGFAISLALATVS